MTDQQIEYRLKELRENDKINKKIRKKREARHNVKDRTYKVKQS